MRHGPSGCQGVPNRPEFREAARTLRAQCETLDQPAALAAYLNPRTQARNLGDFLITAIALRLNYAVLTDDRGLTRQAGRTGGKAPDLVRDNQPIPPSSILDVLGRPGRLRRRARLGGTPQVGNGRAGVDACINRDSELKLPPEETTDANHILP